MTKLRHRLAEPVLKRPQYAKVIDSPLGPIMLTADGINLTGLYLDDSAAVHARIENSSGHTLLEGTDLDIFSAAAVQLDEYFAAERRDFDLPLAPAGTAFQRSVWQGLLDIPYGETSGYGQLAAAVGRPKASRAVGAANGKNPISIIIPCHRVIGADGSLTGYAWGEEKKRILLDFEAEHAAIVIEDAQL